LFLLDFVFQSDADFVDSQFLLGGAVDEPPLPDFGLLNLCFALNQDGNQFLDLAEEGMGWDGLLGQGWTAGETLGGRCQEIFFRDVHWFFSSIFIIAMEY
jgi:hypothetical protein